MTKIVVEVIGWAAAAILLSAYLMLTAGRLTASSRLYQWLNVLAGAGLILNSGWNGAYPSVAINVVWMIIGFWGLIRAAGARRT